MIPIASEKPTYIAADVVEGNNAHLTFLFYGKRTSLATMLSRDSELSNGVRVLNKLFARASDCIKEIKLETVELGEVEDFGEPGKPLLVRRVILEPSVIQARNRLVDDLIMTCESAGVSRDELLSKPAYRFLFPYRPHITDTDQLTGLSRVTLTNLILRN